jgi:hypothetical protein
MATIFKLNQITTALELQDEEDKKNVYLMGLSIPDGTGQDRKVSIPD